MHLESNTQSCHSIAASQLDITKGPSNHSFDPLVRINNGLFLNPTVTPPAILCKCLASDDIHHKAYYTHSSPYAWTSFPTITYVPFARGVTSSYSLLRESRLSSMHSKWIISIVAPSLHSLRTSFMQELSFTCTLYMLHDVCLLSRNKVLK